MHPRPTQYLIAREGWPFVALGILAAIAGGAQGWLPLIVFGWLWIAACMAFFRNPNRTVPQTPGAVISPADGKVVAIDEVDEPHFGLGRMRRVGIFLSVANVHVNRMPFAGTIQGVNYQRGKFLAAWDPKASTQNERCAVHIDNGAGQWGVVVQVAGLVARRIINYLKSEDQVAVGERYGLIRFGSRTDVYLPLGSDVEVVVGDVVRGGETVLGKFAQVAVKGQSHG